MVYSSNEGYPNSENNPDEELHPHNEIINITDTDSDQEEDNPYEGYEPLPVNDFATADDANASSSSSSSGNEENNETNTPTTTTQETLPEIRRIESDLLEEVWSGPPPGNIELDTTKIDEVKQVMSTITLPASSIPEWARNISEEQWKQHLMSRLQNLQK